MESFVDRASMDLCIVMSYCSGGDLTSFIKSSAQRGAKLSESEIKYHFVQMSLALHFMHEKNILHRDLKTGNIFLRKQHGGLVQLGDFGISKVLKGASDLASTCIGTPYVTRKKKSSNRPINAQTHGESHPSENSLHSDGVLTSSLLLFFSLHSVHVARTFQKRKIQSQIRRMGIGTSLTREREDGGVIARFRSARLSVSFVFLVCVVDCLFSLHCQGCILYELTSLKHAFDAGNINGLANKVIHGIYPPISTSYSKDLRELIKSMLGVTPSSRPSIKQILLMPTLLKPIKKYIRQILALKSSDGDESGSGSGGSGGASSCGDGGNDDSGYRPAHILNLRNQLDRLGPPLSGLFAELEKERCEKRAAGASDPRAERRTRHAVANNNELYDDGEESNPIERTLVAPKDPTVPSSSSSDSHAPPTVRRRPRKHAGGASSERQAARLAALEQEHAARVEELRQEELAKAKLEKDFERLQALQAQRAKRLAARKSQLAAGGSGSGGIESTLSSSTSSTAGSSGGASSLPIIASTASSPRLGPTSPTPPANANANAPLPSLNQQSSSSRNASPALHPNRRIPSNKLPPNNLSLHPRAPSPSLPSVAGPPQASSPPPSHLPSPRVSGIPRRITATTTAANSSSGPPSESFESKDFSPPSSSSSLLPTSSGSPQTGLPLSSPPPESLKLLKRKVAVTRHTDQTNKDMPTPATSASLSPPTPTTAISPIQSPQTSHPAERVIGIGGGHRGRPRTNKVFPSSQPPPPPPEGDVEAALKHEKEELERLRIERLRLEELLTRMDEEHGLFTPPVPAPNHNNIASVDASPRVHLRGLKAGANFASGGGGGDLSPRQPSHSPALNQPQQSLHTDPPVKTFSSTVLPAAFDTPLVYKRATLGGGSNNMVGVGVVKSTRRHSTHSDAPVIPRPRGPPTNTSVGVTANGMSIQSPALPNGSTRDRILAAKAAKKSEEAEVEQQRLLQARREYFSDRVKADQRTKEFYGASSSQGQGASSSPPPDDAQPAHLTNQRRRYTSEAANSHAGGHDRDREALFIYDDSALAAHLNSDILPPAAPSASAATALSTAEKLLQDEEDEVSASSLEVEEFQNHLRQYTRRIETLRSVIEVTSRAGGKRPTIQIDDEDDNDDSDDDSPRVVGGYGSDGDRPPSSPDVDRPLVPTTLADRKKQLAQECVNLVGRDAFVAAYDFLAKVRAEEHMWEDDIEDTRKLEKLTKIMGVERVKHWKMIDQLLFVESC